MHEVASKVNLKSEFCSAILKAMFYKRLLFCFVVCFLLGLAAGLTSPHASKYKCTG